MAIHFKNFYFRFACYSHFPRTCYENAVFCGVPLLTCVNGDFFFVFIYICVAQLSLYWWYTLSVNERISSAWIGEHFMQSRVHLDRSEHCSLILYARAKSVFNFNQFFFVVTKIAMRIFVRVRKYLDFFAAETARFQMTAAFKKEFINFQNRLELIIILELIWIQRPIELQESPNWSFTTDRFSVYRRRNKEAFS